jgi:hypothetical protein
MTTMMIDEESRPLSISRFRVNSTSGPRIVHLLTRLCIFHLCIHRAILHVTLTDGKYLHDANEHFHCGPSLMFIGALAISCLPRLMQPSHGPALLFLMLLLSLVPTAS